MMDRKGILFVISAPSGAGKTTLCKAVLEKITGLQFSVSYTTRPPRKEEIDGKDYFFVDETRFKAGIAEGEFIEWAEVHGNLYGTSRQQLRRFTSEGIDLLLDIDTQGAMNLQEQSEEAVYIYILPPSFDILKKRLVNRGEDSPEVVEKRLQKAGDEIRCYHRYQYLIVNEGLEVAQKDLESIILAERVKMREKNRGWVEERFIHLL